MYSCNRCKEVCLERIERGAVYDPGEPGSEKSINFRQLYTDLDLFQVCVFIHADVRVSVQ